MSYDLRIAVKVAGVPKTEPDLYVVIAEPELSNPTYNLGKMFRACTGWDYDQGTFYRVSDVYEKIERGIYELTYNEGKYLSMNPPNGKEALRTLKSLKKCIDEIEDPDSWTQYNTVPKSLMYVAW